MIRRYTTRSFLSYRHLRCGITILAMVFSIVCMNGFKERATIHTTDYLDAAPSHCLVASGSGFRITKADAVALRQFFQPPPTLAEASRLVVDITLAQAMEYGSVQVKPMADRYRAYRLAVENAVHRIPDLSPLAAIERAFDETRKQLGVRLGPCYVTLAEPSNLKGGGA